MKTGISLYPGLGRSCADELALLEEAAAMGITRVFTSLHIPESDTDVLSMELQEILSVARHHHFDVIADVSPKTQELLNLPSLTPEHLLSLGITTVRFDYGFDVRKIALFSHMMKVQLNASTLRPEGLAALQEAGADFNHIDSLHNFYPRPHTGLGEDYVQKQTQWLQNQGISVGLFIPSQAGRRLPLREGLPTLEDDRNRTVDLAARHAQAMGADTVYIGDSAPSQEELTALSHAGREEKGRIVLKARLLSHDPFLQDLLSQPMTARLDPAQDVIRAAESRSRLQGHIISGDETADQPVSYGDITVDNEGYGRYMGEVQISLKSYPGGPNCNRAAYILPEEQFLIPYITPGRAFRLEFVR